MGKGRILILALFAVALSSCSATCTPDKAFADAMNDYSKVVTPEWIKYVEKDTTLDEAQKARRRNLAATSAKTIADFVEKAK